MTDFLRFLRTIKKTGLLSILCLTAIALVSTSPTWALDAGTYTFELYEVGSDGSVSDSPQFSTTATTDDNGKADYSFKGVKSCDTNNVNFYVLKTKNSDGTVINSGLVPAPIKGTTNSLGTNALAHEQTKMILLGFKEAGSDDPLFAAFGYVLTRTPDLAKEDMALFATGGHEVILGDGGFTDEIKDQGATEDQLTSFKKKLICNDTSSDDTLASYSSLFKDAVTKTTVEDRSNKQAEASGKMAKIFIDAANAAGIDLKALHTAFNLAGEKASKNANFGKLSDQAKESMDTSMNSLHQKMESVQMNKRYEKALSTLGATKDQNTRYEKAVTALEDAHTAIEKEYSKYFDSPKDFIKDEGTSKKAIEDDLDDEFEKAYSTFFTAIQATDEEVAALKTAVEKLLDAGKSLPSDFGKRQHYDKNKNTKKINMSICEVVLHTWYITVLGDGGELTYTRGTDTVHKDHWLKKEGKEDGKRIDGGDHKFSVMHNIKEDFGIIQFSFHKDEDTAEDEEDTDKMRKSVKDFETKLKALYKRIGGTSDGKTAITEAEKKAIINLLSQAH